MVTLSRRAIIAGGLGAAGIAALGFAAAATTRAVPSPTPQARNETGLVRSRFSPLVGTTFTAESSAGSFGMVLDSVEDLAPVRTPGEENRFNLLFSATGAEPPQGIYTVRNPDAPETWLFISPVGPDGAPRRFQALVDRSI